MANWTELLAWGGKVRTDFGADESAADLALTPFNKLVVAGGTGQPGNYDMAVARYNPDGSLDTAFDGDGKFVEDFAEFGTLDSAAAVAVQENGSIVVAGDTSPFESGDGGFDFAVLRLNPNGSIDSSFGSNGKVLIDFGGLVSDGYTHDDLADVVIQPDGNIVVSGDAEVEPNRLHDSALARLLGRSSTPATATIKGVASPAAGGTVTGGGTFPVGSTRQLTAIPKSGWKFASWANGNTKNPRTVTVGASGGSYTAKFVQTSATIRGVASPAAGGAVTGGGTYPIGSIQQLTAVPHSGWRFVSWANGSTENPRAVTVAAGGGSYTAKFAQTSSTAGD